MSVITRVGSLVWSSGSKIARSLATAGALQVTKLESHVISVGNLQAGGAGKTPLVAQIANEASARKKSVCILTRGYGGESEEAGTVIRPVEAEPSLEVLDPKKFGDEAVLLHDLAPNAWIAVGSDRVAQHRKATEMHGRPFDIVLLDDGFQHWKIFKDIEVLAVTSRSENDTFHRDFPTEAKRADLVVWTKGETRPQSLDLSRAWSKVRYDLNVSPQDREKIFWLISAIGDSESFRISIEAAGLKVAYETRLSDHATYSRAKIEKWLAEADAKNWKIALTGKDWVKWRAEMMGSKKANQLKDRVSVFEPKLVFESGRDAWEKVLWS